MQGLQKQTVSLTNTHKDLQPCQCNPDIFIHIAPNTNDRHDSSITRHVKLQFLYVLLSKVYQLHVIMRRKLHIIGNPHMNDACFISGGSTTEISSNSCMVVCLKCGYSSHASNSSSANSKLVWSPLTKMLCKIETGMFCSGRSRAA